MKRQDENDNRESLSIADAAKELDIATEMIDKYIASGLETVKDENGEIRIPKVVVESWKNPVNAFRLQWLHQIEKVRSQTEAGRLELINKQIEEFENKYHGTFQQMFGNLSSGEIDGMPEAVDIFDWRELENQKQWLISMMKG